MKKNNQKFSLATIIFIIFFAFLSCHKSPVYKNPSNLYTDSMYNVGIQIIPGKLHCEYYNLGGESVAYHDSDNSNSGSGNLNKGKDYLSTFRINEAVDISFTKFHDSIDNSKYNMVMPKEKQLYLGWTLPGEWTKYTVNVKKTGTYQIGLMYTANQNGQIALESDLSGKSEILNVSSTFHKEDPIAWRNWHHWNYSENLGTIQLKKGVQTLTLNTVAIGQMNYDYLEFTLIK